MGLRQTVLKAARPLAQFVLEAGNFRSRSVTRWFTPGSKVDWGKHAGQVFDNTVVSIAINWISRNWADAPVVVERFKDGKWTVDQKHQFSKDWNDPNPWYGDDTLTDGLIVSLIAGGNGYLGAVRRNAGGYGFVYLPHPQVYIVGGNGANLIDHYEFLPHGTASRVEIDPQDMVHFRLGNDLSDQKKGISPLAMLFRELATDNLATSYSAALLHRMGVPGMIFTPKDQMSEPSPEEKIMWKDAMSNAFTADGAGSLMVVPFPGDVQIPTSGPEALHLDKLQSVPTSRILAAIGLSAMALDLPSDTKTYNNYGEALESAWENCLMPLKTRAARVLTRFVRSHYGEDENVRVWYDYSQVRALQPDMDKLFDRWSKAYSAGVVMRSEAKQALGLTSLPEDEIYATEALMGVRAEGAGLIKAAGILANQRRRALESLTPPED